MKTVKRSKQIEYEVFITSDGKEFTSASEAKNHEDKINGLKKDCPHCNGKGKINERYEREWQNTGWVPTQGEYVQVRKSDTCTECNGKGYLELKWI